MTEFSPTGMHPGVINGKRVYEVVNTAKRRSRARLERALEGWDRHLEHNPRDEMAALCRANCKDKLNSLP
jgi:hypothetical protein